MVDKVKAIELRLQGKTYKEISEELDCSLVWCKKNLKDVVVSKDLSNTQLLLAIKQLMQEVETRCSCGQ